MNSMKEVYKKLKKEFKKIDIKYDEKREVIEIENDGYEITSSISMIELSKKLRYLNHRNPKNYMEIYKYTKKYIKDPEGNLNKITKQRVICLIISIILTILIGLVIGT